jgi:hypothetical protein
MRTGTLMAGATLALMFFAFTLGRGYGAVEMLSVCIER